MRFHRNELPNDNDTVIVCITDVDEKSTIIRVALLEYESIEGNILFSNISKKLKAIKKFISKRGSKPFPCSVFDVDGGIPNLTPVRNDDDWDNAMNKYECYKKLEDLADDFIFQNKDVEPTAMYENFLWAITDRLNEEESIKKDKFSHYLENLHDMFSMSTLDDELIHRLTEQTTPRVTCSDLVLSSSINIMVISSHGLDALNEILCELCVNVEAVYYQDAPSYKLTVKGSSKKECRNYLVALAKKLSDNAEQKGVKALINYDPINEQVKSKIIRLSTINKVNI